MIDIVAINSKTPSFQLFYGWLQCFSRNLLVIRSLFFLDSLACIGAREFTFCCRVYLKTIPFVKDLAFSVNDQTVF